MSYPIQGTRQAWETVINKHLFQLRIANRQANFGAVNSHQIGLISILEEQVSDVLIDGRLNCHNSSARPRTHSINTAKAALARKLQSNTNPRVS